MCTWSELRDFVFEGNLFADSFAVNMFQLIEPLAKVSFCSNSALSSKFYPRHIIYMNAVKFFVCLDFK